MRCQLHMRHRGIRLAPDRRKPRIPLQSRPPQLLYFQHTMIGNTHSHIQGLPFMTPGETLIHTARGAESRKKSTKEPYNKPGIYSLKCQHRARPSTFQPYSTRRSQKLPHTLKNVVSRHARLRSPNASHCNCQILGSSIQRK